MTDVQFIAASAVVLLCSSLIGGITGAFTMWWILARGARQRFVRDVESYALEVTEERE